MDWNFSQLTKLFEDNDANHLLRSGNWGLEKESLRVTEEGNLALTPHPDAFGDKIKNPFVTTDFSESQLELITPPFTSIESTYWFLNNLQVEVEKAIGNELLWPLSMPGHLPDYDEIPVARYNNTEAGKLKEIYREGLAVRYGKKMQLISGLHYNFSFSDDFWKMLYDLFGKGKALQDFINDSYVALTRNFLCFRWLLIYLFGASPTMDESFKESLIKKIDLVKECCIDDNLISHNSDALSIRMSRFGYDNSLQSDFNISYNSLEEYIQNLREVLSTKSDTFSKIGLFSNNRQIQLNDRLLQLENEYYSPIRFKQKYFNDEMHLDALGKRGIEYLELRTFDLNPFEKIGVTLEQLYFIHVFLIYCLFEESKFLDELDLHNANRNAQVVALFGNRKEIKLFDASGNIINLHEWGIAIFDKLKILARLLDKAGGDNKYEQAVSGEYEKLFNPEKLPSFKILNEMNSKGETYNEFGLRKALQNDRTGRLKNNELFSERMTKMPSQYKNNFSEYGIQNKRSS